ncbi:hypothetical protein [Streptomyces sp. VB1]|uniref:hypothetical protein n=1 Tax=Streptomyces sp. VB1 TaxID=2986803 RepID=UPI00224233B4|nr:hypothetical protein [Streptomyces sp. VB1]UZI34032.1 hypothetical protein OH133_38575 [Streptomyces sp. VB1]
MSETDDTTPEPDRRLPLVPLDDARLARALTLQQIGTVVLNDLPIADEYDPVGGAINLARLAEKLTEQTVIIRREQGASWTEIGKEMGVSRQAAHDRWGSVVEAWVMLSRHRQEAPDLTVSQLDSWYADIDPERPDAVSSGLPSLHDPAARRAAQDQRQEALRLHAELNSYSALEKEAFNQSIEATGTPEYPARRREWAAIHLEHAALLDRLAAAEPLVATEHRRRARTQRSLADGIAAESTGRTTTAEAEPAA